MSAEAGRPAALPTTSLPRRGGAGLPAGTRRAASLRLAIAGVAVAALIVYAVPLVPGVAGAGAGTDFSASYVAALLVRAGQGGQIYDQALEAAPACRHPPARVPGNLPFITPPITALLAIPLSFLDPGTAFRLFSLVQLLLLAVAAGVAARAGPWPQGSRGAQLVAAERDSPARRPCRSCSSASGTVFARSDSPSPTPPGGGTGPSPPGSGWPSASASPSPIWRSVCSPSRSGAVTGGRSCGILGGAAGLIAVSMAAVGPGATLGFIGASSFALGDTPAASTLGLLGLAASWLGAGSAATGIAIAGGVLGVAACGFLGWRSHGRPDRLEATLAGAAALSLVVAPHLLAHDLVVLAPAFVWVAARAARLDVPHPWPGRTGTVVLAGWLLLVLLIALDTGAGAPAPPGRLVPWGLMAAAAALAVWERRRHAPATGEG